MKIQINTLTTDMFLNKWLFVSALVAFAAIVFLVVYQNWIGGQ